MATKSPAYRPVEGNDRLKLAVDSNQPVLSGSQQQLQFNSTIQSTASKHKKALAVA
jgi:hypothetical protein